MVVHWQVTAHLTEVGKHAGIRVVPIVGGMSQQKQTRLLHTRPEVVVATPGRLWDYMSRGEKHLVNLRRLTFLVIDEADRMVEKGHYAELESILARLPTVKRAANAESSKKKSRPPLWKKDQPGAAPVRFVQPRSKLPQPQSCVGFALLARCASVPTKEAYACVFIPRRCRRPWPAWEGVTLEDPCRSGCGRRGHDCTVPTRW